MMDVSLSEHQKFHKEHQSDNRAKNYSVIKISCGPFSTWTYGIQLWGTASMFNMEIFERSQSKVLRITTDAPWYISPNPNG
jgi:hypothetical protein